MVLLIGSLVLDALLSKKEEVKIKPIFWIMCILVFLLNGGVSTVSKAHQININSVPTNDFIVWGAIIKTIISAIGFIFLLIFYKKDETKIQEFKETNYSLGVLIVTMGVIVGGVGTLLLLESAKTLPASMQYPFVTGGSTIITATLSRLLYKEKISSIQIVSLVILLIGTILFLF